MFMIAIDLKDCRMFVFHGLEWGSIYSLQSSVLIVQFQEVCFQQLFSASLLYGLNRYDVLRTDMYLHCFVAYLASNRYLKLRQSATVLRVSKDAKLIPFAKYLKLCLRQ